MIQVYPDVGLVDALDILASHNMSMLLFINNLLPSSVTVKAHLVEAAWVGYARQTVPAASWGTTIAAGGTASKIANVVTFSNTSGGSVQAYGFALLSWNSGDLLFATRFDAAPVTIASMGTLDVIPTIGGFSGSL